MFLSKFIHRVDRKWTVTFSTNLTNVPLKTVTRAFQNSPPFKRLTYFYMTTTEYFNFKASFLRNEKPFLKTGVLFLVESTTIENCPYPYKTTLSKTNVKTNRMESTKWIYHIGQKFPNSYFIYLFILKITFQYKNLNQFHNILWVIITLWVIKYGTCELPHELPNKFKT